MLWTYQLEGRRTSYEVCQSLDGSGYELKRRHEDGREEFETFATLEQLNQRIVSLERELLADGWCLAGSGSGSSRQPRATPKSP
jgi:hypothetical protein